MSRFRYSAACKVDAVRRIVEDGRSVCDVAAETGISEGSLFFWVRRYRQLCRSATSARDAMRNAGGTLDAVSREDKGSLVAYLRFAARSWSES